MAELIIHPLTQQQLDDFISAPSHALLLSGPTGIGKQSVAYRLAAQLMDITEEKVVAHQYVRIIAAGKEKSISIDKVRELERFLSRKVPGDGRRVVLIDDAHLLGIEAQNALLKTLEEPPLNTVLILTAAHEQALLPTILSRVQKLPILRPSSETVKAAFHTSGYSDVTVGRAYAMSGGLPGLMTAILEGQDEHPLVQAAGIARQIAQGSTFERLAMVDSLSKDREHCVQILTVLQQMARLSMRSGSVADSWQRVLQGCHTAIGELLASGQPKLVLTNLMLSI
jgi:DNA polymerase-3 subunit delta'